MSKPVTLALYEPERSRPDRSSKFASSRRFQEWLESLPLGNLSAAGNEMLASIQEFNQLRIAPRTRAEMLDRLNEPVLTVVGVLDRHFQETTFPLTEKQDRVARVAIRFFKEMALGYRIAAHETCGDGPSVGFLHKKSASRHIHSSLAATLQMMLRRAMVYQPMPEGAWLEVNTLFEFARANDLHKRSHDSRLARGSVTIEQVFKRLSLIGISDPERLGQRAIRALFEATGGWNADCRLEQHMRITSDETGMFEVDVRSDDPPLLIDEESPPKSVPLGLDIRALRGRLLQQITKNNQATELSFKDASGGRLVIDAELINQLLATWGTRRRRSFKRVHAQHELELLVGISSIHYTLAGDSAFPRFLREYGNPRFAEAAARDRTQFSNRDTSDGRPSRYAAEVLNQSLGGYRLRIIDPRGLQLRVGELVAAMPKSIDGTLELWMVGIIRWLNAIDVREIEVGVALIARDAIASALLVRDDPEAPPVRAIAIDSFRQEDAGQKSLVTPASVPGNRPLDLCIGDDIRAYCGQIDLQERIERNAEVHRYLYKTNDAAAA